MKGPGAAPRGGEALLVAHLRGWVGGWPPRRHFDVVGAAVRARPGWDGRVRPLLGVAAPGRAGPGPGVLAVPPAHRAAVDRHVRAGRPGVPAAGVADLVGDASLAALVDRPDHVLGEGVLRWADSVAGARTLPDAGRWLDADDPMPEWLRPFNGGVLVAHDPDGVVSGVGVKAHDDVGRELAVVTEPRARGRGLGRRLVAQAARRVLADGRLPTYLHDPANAASARVAEAVGFPDRGWRVYGLFPRSDSEPE